MPKGKRIYPEAAAKVKAWNEAHPIGTAVLYDSVISQRGVVAERVRGRAIILGRGFVFAWITRHAGAVLVDRLTVIDDADAPPLHQLLIVRADPFRLLLDPRPAMQRLKRAFHHVHGGWRDLQ